MIDRDAGGAARIGVLSGNRQGPASVILRSVRGIRLQVGLHAAADELGDRHPEAFGAPFDLPVLAGFKLYLKTYHDGMIIPSWIVFPDRRPELASRLPAH
ncbi:MAG TPA: hypothetical protein VES67_10005 [Vicinamibacterales bacterium]|nr:hypothetical protein [Vicinamibacterales bacterium]